MKSKHLIVMICMSFLTVLFLSGLLKNVQGDEGKTTITGGYSEKEEYKEKAKEKLNEFDKKIAEIEVKAKETGYEVKTEAHRGLQELKEKRAALKEDMKRLESSSEKTWETAKKKVNEAMDDLEKTYNRVHAYFK